MPYSGVRCAEFVLEDVDRRFSLRTERLTKMHVRFTAIMPLFYRLRNSAKKEVVVADNLLIQRAVDEA